MKRFIFLAIALSLTCLFFLAGCRSTGSGDSPGKTDNQDTTDTEEIVVQLSIIENGLTEYVVTRPDICGEQLKQEAANLRTHLIDTYRIDKMEIKTDFEMPGADPADRDKYEILVGLTNRAESIEAYDKIRYNDWYIGVSGDKIVIIGGSEEMTLEALEYFTENYILKDSSSLILSSDLNVTRNGEYLVDSLTLGNRELSDYVIVYSSSNLSAARQLSVELGVSFGAKNSITGENSAPSEYEIIIGSAKRGATGNYGYDDYSIWSEGNKIFVAGGSEHAVASGCRRLISLLEKGGDIEPSSISYDSVLPERDVYINDISKLELHWSLYWQTPEWMIDFDEKYASMTDPYGRLMSCLHRGDVIYYPENSIEGIISSIMMGGDMIELDLRRTKDGVVVLMHDETLTRTTNVTEMMGKDGLPNSNKLKDWTYAQIKKLNLKMNGKVTPYKVPTFDEALQVCSERIFLRLDKLEEWSYLGDIWPLIVKHKAYTTVIFTWHAVFRNNSYALVKNYKNQMNAAVGRSSVSFVGVTASSNAQSTLSLIRTNSLDFCVRLTDVNFGTKTPDEYISEYKTLLGGLKDKARVYIDAHGSSSRYENPDDWSRLYSAGINILLVDKGYNLCRYIGETFAATAK